MTTSRAFFTILDVLQEYVTQRWRKVPTNVSTCYVSLPPNLKLPFVSVRSLSLTVGLPRSGVDCLHGCVKGPSIAHSPWLEDSLGAGTYVPNKAVRTPRLTLRFLLGR